ncbi:MAG: putative bifunctional diguanylate cyclase/phosphodiesterase [Solirubrobacteraceae bacterium]
MGGKTDPLQGYVAAVFAAGVACFAAVLAVDGHDLERLLQPDIAVFAACALIGELVPLKVVTRGVEGEVVTSTTFAFAMLITAGPACAVVALVVASLAADALRRKPPAKLLFNCAQYAITLTATAVVLAALTGVPRPGAFHFAPADLPGILVAAGVFFVVNSALVATVIALVQGLRIGRYLVQDSLFQISTGGLMLGLAPMVALAADFALPSVALLFLPLLAVHRGGREAIAKEHQALHDALTGLPNRSLFRDRIEQAVHPGRRADRPAAVMLIDLDHFKEINDTLGHHAGDRLLQEVAQRLVASVPEHHTVARLGGDEFGVLVLDGEDPDTVAKGLLDELREPFSIDGLTLEVDASIGIACAPEHGSAVEQLIQRADIAMYAAKEAGRGHMLFEPQLDRYSPRRLALAGSLRSAIAEGQIVLYFQPKAELTTGRIVGVEALARWRHPRLGLIGPSEFVPIAEQTGLIGPLTTHVLEAALRQVREWSEQGMELTVAVNLSARSFLDAQLASEIPRLLERCGVDAELLELEITESMLMLDPARAKATLDRLDGIGLSLSVDDFGTGYSSLASLKRLPVHGIKIDKSFVIDMPHDPSDGAIVRSTIELAHNLGLRVVAEGVESHEAWERLAELGCDLAQGFHVSRPLPPDAMGRLLADRRERVLA